MRRDDNRPDEAGHSGRVVLAGLSDGPGDAHLEAGASLPELAVGEASERTRILMAIEKNGGSRLLAARALGMGRSTLYRKLTRLGIATQRD